MANVFNSISESRGVFRSEEPLSPDFVPDKLPGREREEKEVAGCLKPASEGKQPVNLFIHGPSGTGKTSTCRHVMRQLADYSSKPLPIYVNCWQNSTRQAILAVLGQMAGDVLPRRGLAADEIFIRVLQHLKNEKRVPVLVLDEADKLFIGGEEQVLYDLSRAHETYGVPVGIVLVTNEASLMAKADGRIRSSLACQELQFKQYSPQELKNILAERSRLAFAPNACGDEVIALCAAHGAKNGGDCRVSIQALWRAGKNCERRGASALSLDDVRKAIDSSTTSAEQKRERDEQGLGEGEKVLLLLIREKPRATVGDLYATFASQAGGSERSARNYLRELEARGFVVVEDAKNERGEKVRVVSPK